MKKAILATKVGMTQIFNEDGQLIPVTVLQAGPCVVTQVKTERKTTDTLQFRLATARSEKNWLTNRKKVTLTKLVLQQRDL